MKSRTDADREERIRARAYAIWRKAGEPTGQDKAHWAKATQEIDEEDGQAEVHGEPVAASATPTAEEFASPPEQAPNRAEGLAKARRGLRQDGREAKAKPLDRAT